MIKLIDITGKAISGEWGTDDESGTGIPVLRTTNFTNIGVVNYNDVVTRTITKKNIEDKYLRKGDIIIEKSGGSDNQPVGRVIYFDGEENKYLFNNFTGLLRVKNVGKWYPKYVFYALFANYKKGGTKPFENRTTGLHNLQTDSYINHVEIKDIDIETQKQIVKTLDKLAVIINQRQQELDKLDEIIKARFVEMFANKGYPQVEVGKLLIQNTTVEKIQNTKMEKFVTIGVRGSGARQRAIKDGKWPVPFSGYRVKSGQFIYSRIDARNGAFAILSDDLHDAVVSKDFPVFNIDTKQILPNVFLHSVLEDRFVKQIQNNSFGATNRQRIQEEVFAKYTISLAPLDVQKEYEAFCNQIDKSKLIFWKSLANLHTERHGCLYIFNIVSNSTYKM